MDQRISSYYRTLAWVLLFVVIGVLYAYYFLAFVPNREAQVISRGFRILNNYRLNMEEKDKLNVTRVSTLGKSFIKRDLYPYIEKGQLTLSINGKVWKKERYKKEYLNKYASFLSPNITFHIDSLKDICPACVGKLHFNDSMPSRLIHMSRGRPEILYSVYNLSDKQFLNDLFEGENSSIATNEAGNIGYIKSPFSKFLRGLKYDELFENLVIINNGSVLYNEHPSKYTYSGEQLDTLFNTGTLSGSFCFLNVNAQEKLAINLPVQLFGEHLRIIGFIDGDNFSFLTRSINPHLLFVLVSFILLLCIIFPILKVRLVNRNERISAEDIYMSGFSIILGVSLGILIILGVYNHFVIENQKIEQKLEYTSRYLKKEVEQDFMQAIRLKDNVVHHLQSNRKYVSSGKVQLDYQALVKDTRFNFNELLLLDTTGHFEYMVVMPGNERPEERLRENNVSYRKYFQRANQDQLWHMQFGHGNKQRTEAMFVESVYSIVSQKGEAAISFPRIQLYDSLVLVPVVTSTFPSLFEPIVPPDISFAIVDENCKTLFHKNFHKNDKENFLVETENSKALKALIDQRVTDVIGLRYNQKTWVARVSPIHGTDLFMVVMYERTFNYYKDARIIFYSFIFLLFNMLLIVGYCFLVKITKPTYKLLNIKRFSFSWLVYDPDNYYRYNMLMSWFFVLLILSVWAIIKIKSIDIAILHVVYVLSFLSLQVSVLLTRKDYIFRHFFWKENQFASYQLLVFVGINIAMLSYAGGYGAGSASYIAWYPLISLFMLWQLRKSGHRLHALKPISRSHPDDLPKFPYTWLKFRRGYGQYVVFLFVWLLLVTLGPTMLFFKVSYYAENRLWDKWQQMELVHSWQDTRQTNVQQAEVYTIDSVSTLEVIPAKNRAGEDGIEGDISNGNKIFKALRLPITGNQRDMSGFLFEKSSDNTYFWQRDTLFYQADHQMFRVSPASVAFKALFQGRGSILFWIAMLVFLAVAYTAMRYLLNMIFYSEPSNQVLNVNPQLDDLIDQTEWSSHILLVGYDSNNALQSSMNSWGHVLAASLADQQALQALLKTLDEKPDESFKVILFHFEEIVQGREECAYILDVLQALSFTKKHKIILGCALDIDVIRMTFSVWTSDSAIEEEVRHAFKKYEKRLEHLLAAYIEIQMSLTYLEQCPQKSGLPSHVSSAERIKSDDVVLDLFLKKELCYGYFLHDIRCNAYIDKTIGKSDADIKEKKDLWKIRREHSFKKECLYYWDRLRGENVMKYWQPVKPINDFTFYDMRMTPGAADEIRNRKENIVLRVNNLSENFYQLLWSYCSPEEKLILYDLAEDEITNLKNRYVLKKLIKKGLIVHDKKLRIFNLSFRNFIMTFTRKQEAVGLENSARSKGRWNNSRLILITIILSIIIFMFMAEQRVIDKALGLFSASLAVLPALYKLFDSLLKKSSDKKNTL